MHRRVVDINNAPAVIIDCKGVGVSYLWHRDAFDATGYLHLVIQIYFIGMRQWDIGIWFHILITSIVTYIYIYNRRIQTKDMRISQP